MNLFSKKVHKVEIYGYSYGCKNLEKMCVFVIGDVHEILVELVKHQGFAPAKWLSFVA